MLVVPELEKEVELLWEFRDTRKVFGQIGSNCLFCFASHWGIKLYDVKILYNASQESELV